MKVYFVFIIIFLNACASKVALNDRVGYAYIYTKHLERNLNCNGESIKIVGVRQAGKKVVFTSVHSIYVPEGENYIYYTPVFEYLKNGVCGVAEEVLVQHNEVDVPPLERRPMGFEKKIDVEEGKSYVLIYSQGTIEVKEFVQ